MNFWNFARREAHVEPKVSAFSRFQIVFGARNFGMLGALKRIGGRFEIVERRIGGILLGFARKCRHEYVKYLVYVNLELPALEIARLIIDSALES